MLSAAARALYAVRSIVTPLPSASSEGTLTADDFIAAGDALSFTSNWRWCAGDDGKVPSYLPRSRTFLELTGIPSAPQPHLSLGGACATPCDGKWAEPGMEMIDEAVSPTPTSSTSIASFTMSICFDAVYGVPRIYLTGNRDGAPLSPHELLSIISSDYTSSSRPTVTLELHPHRDTTTPHISIHPCRHASAMKALLSGCAPGAYVPSYLPALLKLLSAAMPSLEYGEGRHCARGSRGQTMVCRRHTAPATAPAPPRRHERIRADVAPPRRWRGGASWAARAGRARAMRPRRHHAALKLPPHSLTSPYRHPLRPSPPACRR